MLESRGVFSAKRGEYIVVVIQVRFACQEFLFKATGMPQAWEGVKAEREINRDTLFRRGRGE